MEAMKNPILLAIATLILAGVSAAAPRPADWKKELNQLEARYGGHLGFMAKNLKTGEILAYNASEQFPTASAIKLPILAAFYHLVDEKKIDPEQTIILKNEDRKPGSGVLRLLSEGDRLTLLDAARLMITESDNTAANLVLDRLADTHARRLATVNDFLIAKGLKDTRLLNRLYSLETKTDSPEAVRYGIGVSSPEDMILLVEQLYKRTLVSPASSNAILSILQDQSDRSMAPRLLPRDECKFLQIGNKTGAVNETKVDVALILSDKADIAMAIFVDKHPDHRSDIENRAILLGAMAARAAWNHFTGSRGYEQRNIPSHDVDWNSFPGGRWGIYRSAAAPFPSRTRNRGTKINGTVYPLHPHYDDDSIVVVVPESFRETSEGTNLILHFHGAMTDNMAALEQFEMPQALSAAKANAILVLPQGPYRAPDGFFGNIESSGGLKRLIDDVLLTMKKEDIIKTALLNRLILSADGAGAQAIAAVLKQGKIQNQAAAILLFHPELEDRAPLRAWLAGGKGLLFDVSLRGKNFIGKERLGQESQQRVREFDSSKNPAEAVREFFPQWIKPALEIDF
jgi:beta-lactamase class A